MGNIVNIFPLSVFILLLFFLCGLIMAGINSLILMISFKMNSNTRNVFGNDVCVYTSLWYAQD